MIEFWVLLFCNLQVVTSSGTVKCADPEPWLYESRQQALSQYNNLSSRQKVTAHVFRVTEFVVENSSPTLVEKSTDTILPGYELPDKFYP